MRRIRVGAALHHHHQSPWQGPKSFSECKLMKYPGAVHHLLRGVGALSRTPAAYSQAHSLAGSPKRKLIKAIPGEHFNRPWWPIRLPDGLPATSGKAGPASGRSVREREGSGVQKEKQRAVHVREKLLKACTLRTRQKNCTIQHARKIEEKSCTKDVHKNCTYQCEVHLWKYQGRCPRDTTW